MSQITSPTREAIKETVNSLNKSPSSAQFWKLSRIIRFANPSDVKANIDQIAKLVMNNRNRFLGAIFANAHLLRVSHFMSYPDSYKWCRNFVFSDNVIYNAHIYNIASLSTYSNSLSPKYELLDSYNAKVQKIGAAAIARHAKTPANLLRRVLASMSKMPPNDVEPLNLPEPENIIVRHRGLVILASFLSSYPVGLSEYLNPLLPILMRIPESEHEKSLDIEIQLLLAKLMMANPTAMHNSKIFEAAIVQVKSNNMTPEFLEALVISFGLFAFKKFIISLIPLWIDNLRGQGFEFIKIIAPYSKFFETELQLQIQLSLIEFCEKNRFNKEAFLVTTTVMMCSHPTISPYIGRFIEAVQNSVCRRLILSKLKPVLEPKIQPIMHPMKDLMKIKELEKKDEFTQVSPTVKSILINCDMSREIRNLPKPESSKASSNILSNKIFLNSKANSDPSKSNQTNGIGKASVPPAKLVPQPQKATSQIEIDLDDVDINLDGPDSDDDDNE